MGKIDIWYIGLVSAVHIISNSALTHGHDRLVNVQNSSRLRFYFTILQLVPAHLFVFPQIHVPTKHNAHRLASFKPPDLPSASQAHLHFHIVITLSRIPLDLSRKPLDLSRKYYNTSYVPLSHASYDSLFTTVMRITDINPGALSEDDSDTVSYTHLTLPTKRIV